MLKIINYIFSLLALYSFSVLVLAAEQPEKLPSFIQPPYADYLLGDQGGKRSELFNNGYDWQVLYKLDFLYNTTPSIEKAYALDNLDIKLNLDFEKITGSKGLTAFFHILSNRGDKPAAHSGRLPHGLDNIETSSNGNTTKFFQAWLQQSFFDEKLSILAGLYDLNSEFYATESSSIFIHPTFGIGAELAGSGINGPSIFPTSSVAIRLKTEPAPGYYFQAITLDGVPGDPDNPQGTHVQFNNGDGALNVIEAGIPIGAPENAHNNKLAFGVWQYTTQFDDLIDTDTNGNPIQRVSHGTYVILEKVLNYYSGSNEERITGFIRAGHTEGDTTQFDFALSAGIVFRGLFEGYEEDELGFAYAQERNSEKYRLASGNDVPYEKSYELGYRHHAAPGFIIQPFIQFLRNHSAERAQDRTWWVGVRLEAAL